MLVNALQAIDNADHQKDGIPLMGLITLVWPSGCTDIDYIFQEGVNERDINFRSLSMMMYDIIAYCRSQYMEQKSSYEIQET